ncbi:PREDICTED: neuroepithelial cell-transforming gene 1 protein-like isoform X2 [Polistes canadensis]|uniref:neuroepithelial cell-transforming gene 1 protein-like isoform X2 n=1 Tax=Polistes canadensis TaxID=91411 RepID=UPI000718E937|nr:PREDICTED: neuroepithelial cell-transforming gene 1 protein-like isoform X2 [Polistes canadensis]
MSHCLFRFTTILRSRKRPKSDVVSVNSMDISIESDTGKKKKRRRITEVASSIFSSSTLGVKVGNTLHRSFSIQQNTDDFLFTDEDAHANTIRKKRRNSSDGTNNFTLRSWLLDIANANVKETLNSTLGQREVKRQEAIYELCCGENLLIDELTILHDHYYAPLVSSNIFTLQEIRTLFSDLTRIIEIHGNLRNELINLRDCSGFTDNIGATILNWIPKLTEPYLERCRTQVWARHLLEEKKATNKRFQAFLKRKLGSPHSLDLWAYLDVPRSRIVKYPLLIKEILRHTTIDHLDQIPLQESINKLTELLQNIDEAMGKAECKLAQTKINIKNEYDPTECINNATELITEGQLKDARGMKFYCFLFDTCFAMTRSTRRIPKKYNLYFPVIPREQISLCTEQKNCTDFGFKIGDYFLISEDKHGKRHWTDACNKIINSLNTKENNGNENKLNLIMQTPNRSIRKSGNSKDENFTFPLKKNVLKQKQNSISFDK